jgi:transporter family protein
MNINNYTYLAIIIAFIWGISPVLFKFFLHKNIPTYLIIFFQAFVYLLSSSIYILISKRNKFIQDIKQNINYIPFLVIISFFSVYIANVLYIYALENKGNVSIMSIIIALAPVITMIFAYLIFKEKLEIKAYIGFFIIFVGLILIFVPFR